ncbi:hypothetical protein [Oceanobacillus sp. CFH 90083]|uniref:hypothetical protein n=1 Tax=Oceanobacillus sp. CFH 90083 TaxID=2592336 RepID=UPI0018838124|nr:hypothetical protein [Oceanobacillus sp. CFH 90083]
MTLNLRYDQGRIRKYHYFMLLSLIQKYKKVSRSQLAKLGNDAGMIGAAYIVLHKIGK